MKQINLRSHTSPWIGIFYYLLISWALPLKVYGQPGFVTELLPPEYDNHVAGCVIYNLEDDSVKNGIYCPTIDGYIALGNTQSYPLLGFMPNRIMLNRFDDIGNLVFSTVISIFNQPFLNFYGVDISPVSYNDPEYESINAGVNDEIVRPINIHATEGSHYYIVGNAFGITPANAKMFVMEVDEFGTVLWVSYGFDNSRWPGGEIAVSVESLPNGDLFCVGQCDSVNGQANMNILVGRFDGNGTLLWANKYYTPGQNYFPRQSCAFATSEDYGLAIVGNNTVPGNQTASFISRINPNGTERWRRRITGYFLNIISDDILLNMPSLNFIIASNTIDTSLNAINKVQINEVAANGNSLAGYIFPLGENQFYHLKVVSMCRAEDIGNFVLFNELIYTFNPASQFVGVGIVEANNAGLVWSKQISPMVMNIDPPGNIYHAANRGYYFVYSQSDGGAPFNPWIGVSQLDGNLNFNPQCPTAVNIDYVRVPFNNLTTLPIYQESTSLLYSLPLTKTNIEPLWDICRNIFAPRLCCRSDVGWPCSCFDFTLGISPGPCLEVHVLDTCWPAPSWCFTWDLSPGLGNPVQKDSATWEFCQIPYGTYTICITIQECCECPPRTICHTFTYDPYSPSPRNIQEADNSEISIYPNPVFSDRLIVGLPKNSQSGIMSIFTCRGEKIQEHKLNSTYNEVEVKRLIPGIYLSSILLEDGRIYNKIIDIK